MFSGQMISNQQFSRTGILVESLSAAKVGEIISCVSQSLRDNENEAKIQKDFYFISVWFADVANQILKSNTPNNGYCVMYKTEFNNPNLTLQAQKIWNCGYLPIEVVRKQGCIFIGVAKNDVNNFLNKGVTIEKAFEFDMYTSDE